LGVEAIMLEFKRLTLDDKDIIEKYFIYSVNRICDNTIGGALIWRDYFAVEYALYNDTVVFKARMKNHNNITAFSVPLGEDVYGVLDKITEYCDSHGLPVTFFSVTGEGIETLKKRFDKYELFTKPDWSDYIYKFEDLATLSGRRYSGQRNHINGFIKNHDSYTFEEITGDNLKAVQDFYSRLCADATFSTEIALEEHNKTIEVLDKFDIYGLYGGLIKTSGEIIAFAVGEVMNGVLFVHIEKADTKYRGAYQIINKEFASRFISCNAEYINREEDDGVEGLRISKLSYHPHEIVEKYILHVV